MLDLSTVGWLLREPSVMSDLDAAAIKAELKARNLLPSHQSSDQQIRDTSSKEEAHLRNIAFQIVDGDLSSLEVEELDETGKEKVASMVSQLISRRSRASLRELEEANPFADILSSSLIRDGSTAGE